MVCSAVTALQDEIMSAVAMVKEPWGETDIDVREAMSGNICRCGAYPNIVAAVQAVRRIVLKERLAMELFQLVIAQTVPDAVKAQAQSATAQNGADIRFIAGGTNLVDYMKLNVERPRQLVDINRLPLDKIERSSDGGLKIGALARNADVAQDPIVKEQYAVLSQALLSGASPQLRNMATTAGNLLQKTRCVYYRDTASACNKRQPGSGCSAIGGYNRMLAILGTSDHCIATNPSDQNVALMALEAVVHIEGTNGQRAVPISEFYLLPGSTPERETVLQHWGPSHLHHLA